MTRCTEHGVAECEDCFPLWQCQRCGEHNAKLLNECENCETPKGWEYDGPSETDDMGGGVAELAERQDKIQRELKR